MAGVVFILGVAATAHAQATRTWVSGVGDDANPCSRTAPCKTFAGAISKTAAGGFINIIDPGGFGGVTITKSITIDGDGSHAGLLVGSSNGIIVNGAGIIVNLRNLSIESPLGLPGTNGISVLQAAEVHIDHCTITGFSNTAVTFNPSGGGEGYVSNTTIVGNPGGGIVVARGRMVVLNLNAEGNGNGVVVNGPAIATVTGSRASGGGAGFGAVSSPSAVINIDSSTMTHNLFGVFAATGGTVRVSNSMIVSNVDTGLYNDGSSFIVSLGGNSLIGNPTPGAFTSTAAKQ
jgi:hypothetical protein